MEMNNKTYVLVGIVLGLSIIGALTFFSIKDNTKIEEIDYRENLDTYQSRLTEISSNENIVDYYVDITGYEAEIFENPRVYDNLDGTVTLVLDIKTTAERTKEVCTLDSKISKTTCTLKTEPLPTTLDIKDETGTKEGEVIVKDESTFSYTFSKSLNYVKLGNESIVIIPSVSYSSTNLNVTTKPYYARLTVTGLPPYDDLVFYTPFDSGTSLTTQYDYSYTNGTGTELNQVFQYGNPLGYGLASSFDGTNDYITFSDNAKWDIGTGNVTISVWVKPLSTGQTEAFGVIASKGGLTNQNGYCLFIDDTDGSVVIQLRNVTVVNQISSSSSISDGNWHHVVGVIDRNKTDGIKIYIDGVFDRATNASILRSQNLDNSVLLSVGTRRVSPAGAYAYDYAGDMDELMIFRDALNQSEVEKIYRNQSRRFHGSGTQTFLNQNVSSLGTENTLNITFDNYTHYLDSNISISINNGQIYQLNDTGGASNVVFSGDPNRINLTLRYSSGNVTNPFYTPLLIQNITLNSFTTAGADSCTYTSGNWVVDCSDNCIISSNVNLNNNNIYLTGTGTFTINNGIKVFNYGYLKTDKTCYSRSIGTGGFYHNG